MRYVSALATSLCIAFTVAVNAQTDHSAEALHYLRLAMAEHLIDLANFEIAARQNIAETPDGFLALGITSDQTLVNGGMRAEVSVNYPFSPGDTVKYSWRFRLSEDFQSDGPENRWILIAQWHDQPDVSLGETWGQFKSSSPPIALALGEKDGQLSLVVVYGKTATGHHQQTSDPVILSRGVWYTVDVIVGWSQSETGYAEASIDGHQIAQLAGANMNNTAGHYFKSGIYRHPGIEGDAWINLDSIAISHQ